MRAVVQRVTGATVTVADRITGQIGKGLLVFVGVAEGDTDADAERLATKIAELRVFPDDHQPMNADVASVGGAVLVVSQFTLLGDARKGRRPSFIDAAKPEEASILVQRVGDALRARGLEVAEGEFRAHMDVALVNDGPVTILIDTRKTF